MTGGEVKGRADDVEAGGWREKAEAKSVVKERLVRIIASVRRRGKRGLERLDEMVALTVCLLFSSGQPKVGARCQKRRQRSSLSGFTTKGSGRRGRCSRAETPELMGCLSRAGSSRTCASSGGGIKRGFAGGLQGEGEERREEGEVRLNE